MFNNHPQWKYVKKICETLKNNNYTAWLAGGCVRDGLLNVSPQDFDVVTNATPDTVQALFPGSLDIGKSFGIIILPIENKFKIEIATFRNDGTYEDGRRPTHVVFSTPQEDAQRRDFTVNAMFYDPFLNEIYDYVNGKMDLKNKVLKTVGIAEKRFQEDKLRMLRAIRFSSQLDFQIEENTYNAIVSMASSISCISQERITYEIERLFQTKKSSRGLQLLNDSGLLKNILHIEYEEHQIQKLIKILNNNETANPDLKWMFFWNLLLTDKLNLKDQILILKKFKHSKEFVSRYNYVTEEMRNILEGKIQKAQKYILAYDEAFSTLYEVAKQTLSPEEFSKIEEVFILKSDFAQLPIPLINGKDLIELGVSPGNRMKELLERIYFHQLENKVLDKNEMLLWTKNQIN